MKFIRLLLLFSCGIAAARAAEPPPTGIDIDVPPGESRPVDLQSLFAPPVAIVDMAGAAIVTGRAAGHAAVMDWNGDGVPDILLAAHDSMNTADASVLDAAPPLLLIVELPRIEELPPLIPTFATDWFMTRYFWGIMQQLLLAFSP